MAAGSTRGCNSVLETVDGGGSTSSNFTSRTLTITFGPELGDKTELEKTTITFPVYRGL